jgi:hypothetical protein
MAKIEQPDWVALNKLLDNGNIATFWATYANYLHSTGVISNARIVIHRAAVLTTEALRVQEKNPR